MSSDPVHIPRPQRWDVPFDAAMTEADVDRLLTLEPFAGIDPGKFSPSLSLRGILRNDTRLLALRRGDILFRRGDYGHSAFVMLSGSVRMVLDGPEHPIPPSELGRQVAHRKGLFGVLSQLWRNHGLPEVRDPTAYLSQPRIGQRGRSRRSRLFIHDVPAVLDEFRSTLMTAGDLFGEYSALGRVPRPVTAVAEGDAEVLEIRWQGLRDLLRRDPEFHDKVYETLRGHIRAGLPYVHPLFQHLTEAEAATITAAMQFQTFGTYEWGGAFRAKGGREAPSFPGALKDFKAAGPAAGLEDEPVIAEQGHYPNGLLLIQNGLARLTERFNHGERTVGYLGLGQVYGLEELAPVKRGLGPEPYRYTLRAVGYVNAILVPTPIVEEYILKRLPAERIPLPLAVTRPAEPGREQGLTTDLLEFLVERRYINGTATMIIDLDRCTRCDDCVRACAGGHDNNPRFLRQGPQHGHYMVAHACMHCRDPVCMIECPTGAIQREMTRGMVVINDRTCIGCAACASNCPYDAIRLVEVRDAAGNFILDHQTNRPILKATKCDLCAEQWGGPACQRACPHDALRRVDMRTPEAPAEWLNR